MLIPVLSKHLKLKDWKGFHPNSKKNRSNFLAINNLTEKAKIDLWLNEMEKYANESKAVIISFRHSRSDGNSFYDPIYPATPQIFFENLSQRLNQISKFVPKT